MVPPAVVPQAAHAVAMDFEVWSSTEETGVGIPVVETESAWGQSKALCGM